MLAVGLALRRSISRIARRFRLGSPRSMLSNSVAAQFIHFSCYNIYSLHHCLLGLVYNEMGSSLGNTLTAFQRRWFAQPGGLAASSLILATLHFQQHLGMTPSTFPATKLFSSQRIDLAIAAMAGSANISNVAVEYQVSRKFIYQQKDKATIALNEAFAATAPDDAVLFHLPVTKTWLNQLTLSLTLICNAVHLSPFALSLSKGCQASTGSGRTVMGR